MINSKSLVAVRKRERESSNLKNKKGITLIALVVTIVILLILAGVTIATLTGDNGLLQKSTNAKQANEESTICENIKLAYGEYQIAQHTGTDKTAEKIIEDNLKLTYGDNIQKVKVKNEKVTVNMTVSGELKTYIFKSTTGDAYEYVDPFNYGEKTKKTVVPGDDIILGTEKFRVFYNQDGVIKAMPWYNLVTVTEDGTVKQGPAVAGKSTTITSAFSTENYWKNYTQNHKEVDMEDSRNIIKQYIESYEKYLESLRADLIQVRNGNYTELNQEDVTNSMRNPGKNGSFWLNTSYASSGNWIDRVVDTGSIDYDGYYGKRQVRPIIIIEY